MFRAQDFIFVAVVALSLSACSSPHITVEQLPVALTSAEVPAGSIPRHDALTRWFFHCEPTFEYDVVPNGDPKAVTVQIRGVKMKIGLSVIEHLPKGTNQKLLDHEQGHVEICRRVYSSARQHAEACCQNIMGKQFTGFGSEPRKATETALGEAAGTLCSQYTRLTADVANDVSEDYDTISAHGRADENPLITVDKAFKDLPPTAPGRRI